MFYIRSRDQNLRLSSIHAQIQTKILNSQAFRWWLPGWTQRTSDIAQPSYPTNIKKWCVVKGYQHALAIFSLTQKKVPMTTNILDHTKKLNLEQKYVLLNEKYLFSVFSDFLGVKGWVVMRSSVVNLVYHHQLHVMCRLHEWLEKSWWKYTETLWKFSCSITTFWWC